MTLRFLSPYNTGGSAPPAPTIKVLDNFVDTDGTTLQDHTPDVSQGGPWTNISIATMEIQSNLAVSVGYDATYAIDAGTTTGTLTTSVLLEDGGFDDQCELAFNWNSYSDGWFCVIVPTDGYSYFYEYGGVGQVGFTTYSFTPGPQVWKLVHGPAAIEFFVDGVLKASYASPNIRAGATKWGMGVLGFGSPNPGFTKFSQFKVTVP